MSIFTRTPSGIKNSAKFYGVSYMAYVEGKQHDPSTATDSHAILPDVRYYEQALTLASGGLKFKVKCVGNKNSALDYAKKISNKKIANSIVVVDKDYEGVTSSAIRNRNFVTTLGYSWENDLWTPKSLAHFVQQVVVLSNAASRKLRQKTTELARRLHFLCSLDAASQLHGKPLLPKNNSVGGINLNFSSATVISTSEVKRFVKKFRTVVKIGCHLSRSIFKYARALKPNRVIQGHIWANACSGLFTEIYKKYCSDSTPSKKIILTLLLSELRSSPAEVISHDVAQHYRKQLVALGLPVL